MPFAEAFAQHSAGHFRIPVIERAEEREQNSANDYVMKVRHDEIGKTKLPIERAPPLHNAGEAGD